MEHSIFKYNRIYEAEKHIQINKLEDNRLKKKGGVKPDS